MIVTSLNWYGKYFLRSLYINWVGLYAIKYVSSKEKENSLTALYVCLLYLFSILEASNWIILLHFSTQTIMKCLKIGRCSSSISWGLGGPKPMRWSPWAVLTTPLSPWWVESKAFHWVSVTTLVVYIGLDGEMSNPKKGIDWYDAWCKNFFKKIYRIIFKEHSEINSWLWGEVRGLRLQFSQ